MTAQVDDVQRDSKSPIQLSLKVKTAVTLFKGAMAVTDATGYALPGANTAGMFFQGIVQKQADNSGGASGAIPVIVERSDRFVMTMAGAAITDIGKDVYISDDTTLTLTVGNGIYVGKIVGLTGANLVEVQPVYSKAAIAAAIADPAAMAGITGASMAGPTGSDPGALVGPTFTSHSWNGSTDPSQAEGDEIVADLGTYKTAIDGNNTAIDANIVDIAAAKTAIDANVVDIAAAKTAIDILNGKIDDILAALRAGGAVIA